MYDLVNYVFVVCVQRPEMRKTKPHSNIKVMCEFIKYRLLNSHGDRKHKVLNNIFYNPNSGCCDMRETHKSNAKIS